LRNIDINGNQFLEKCIFCDFEIPKYQKKLEEPRVELGYLRTQHGVITAIGVGSALSLAMKDIRVAVLD